MRPTYIEVDLDALRHNVRELKSLLAPGVRFMAVVKADAYGHGLLPVTRAACEAGADMLGVAIVEEGVALRQAGVRVPVLVLGATLEAGCEDVVRNDLMQTVFTSEQFSQLARAARAQGRRVSAHVKVDTGMGRIGVRGHRMFAELIAEIDVEPSIGLSGVFTHFASADEADEDARKYTSAQIDEFRRMTQPLRGRPDFLRHAANSAGTIDWPEAHFDMVRCGIAMYGSAPSTEMRRVLPLRPVLHWHTRIVHTKWVAGGTCISYGRTFRTEEERCIATLPVGYGDGYHRMCGNRASVLVRGHRAPVVGRVCMDQMMIDITELQRLSEGEPIGVGEPVVLLGEQNGAQISAQDLAGWAGTIPYECLLAALPRVPRKTVG